MGNQRAIFELLKRRIIKLLKRQFHFFYYKCSSPSEIETHFFFCFLLLEITREFGDPTIGIKASSLMI